MKYRIGEKVEVTSGRYRGVTGNILKINENGDLALSGGVIVSVDIVKRVLKRK